MAEGEYDRDIAAVHELFHMDGLTKGEVEQGLVTIRDLARESLLGLADAVGIRDRAAFYLDVIVEATILLKR